MQALQELRDGIAEKRARAKDQKQAVVQAALKREKQQLVEQVGQELLEELQAEFRIGSYERPQIRFTYRGKLSKWYERFTTCRPPITAVIADWTAAIDREIAKWEQERESKRQKLLAEFALEQQETMKVDGWILKQAESTTKQYDLNDDEALVKLLWTYRQKVNAKEEAERQQVAEEKQRKKDEWEARRTKVLAALTQVTERSDLDPLHDDIHVDGYYDWPGGRFAQDEEVEAVYEAALERIAKAREEREQARLKAEAEAFDPFCFYRVYYGMVYDGEEGYLEQDCFDSLRPDPNEKGWWIPASSYKNPLRLAHLIKVEKVSVWSPGDLPRWCPTEETEWGSIKVPPEGADPP